MDINSVVYVKNMPAAGTLTGAELLHISQGNLDNKMTLNQLVTAFNNSVHPVGSLELFAVAGKDPNALFPGQSWIRFNAGRSIRSAAADSDVGNGMGADSITLEGGHLPAHTHAGANLTVSTEGNHNHTGTTSGVGDHSHGAWTAGAGYHNHQDGCNAPGGQWNTMITGTNNGGRYGLNYTSSVGDHSHGVGMNGAGSHSHSFTTWDSGSHTHAISGTLASNGSSQAISTIEATQYFACWLRTQ